MHDNTGAHNCKLVHEFLETETVIQLPKLSYSQDLSHCVFIMITFSPDVDVSPQCHCSVSTGCAHKSLLICIQ